MTNTDRRIQVEHSLGNQSHETVTVVGFLKYEQVWGVGGGCSNVCLSTKVKQQGEKEKKLLRV